MVSGRLLLLELLAVSHLFQPLAEQTQETFYNGAWHYTDGHLSGFQSISDCFWIVIQTLSTVGYGDTGKLVYY